MLQNGGGGGTVLTCETFGSLVHLCTLQWGRGRTSSGNYGQEICITMIPSAQISENVFNVITVSYIYLDNLCL